MKTTIYKIKFKDGKTILTNDRPSIADEYNRIYRDKEGFKEFNINTINGMLYNKNKLKKDIEAFDRFSYREYYKDYIEQYEKTLNSSLKSTPLKKTYVRVRTNNVLNMIFDIESNYINNNKDITEMEQRIQQAISIH
tara:strand:- start:47 stop:457 length:411 start_codon:yes stop_codon:yes gene_type:complete